MADKENDLSTGTPGQDAPNADQAAQAVPELPRGYRWSTDEEHAGEAAFVIHDESGDRVEFSDEELAALLADQAAEDAAPPKDENKAAGDKPKAKRSRRGPPAQGDEPEARVTVLLATSRYQDSQGGALRRGRPVNVPESRLDGLLLKGKVRVPAKGELTRALATWPAVDLF